MKKLLAILQPVLDVEHSGVRQSSSGSSPASGQQPHVPYPVRDFKIMAGILDIRHSHGFNSSAGIWHVI